MLEAVVPLPLLAAHALEIDSTGKAGWPGNPDSLVPKHRSKRLKTEPERPTSHQAETGHPMKDRSRVEIRSQKLLLDDFFKVNEVIVSHQQYDGKMSPDQRRLVFERGDAVAALLFNIDTRSVVLVEQFKIPSLVGRRRDDPATTNGWITELMAGMINENETAEDAVIRETLEETGYKIKDPQFICKFFSSPGGTSERIFLYFAKVSESQKPGTGGGISDEDIRVVQISVNELFNRLAKGLIDDPKLAIGAYWLQGHLAELESLEPDTVQSKT